MDELTKRRTRTADRITELRKKLINADAIVADKACVYATGSFGRGEASDFSDLDLFIVGRSSADAPRVSFIAYWWCEHSLRPMVNGIVIRHFEETKQQLEAFHMCSPIPTQNLALIPRIGPCWTASNS